MKKYLLALALLTASTTLADSIVVRLRMEWTTNNGATWNDDLNTDDFYSLGADVSPANAFFFSKITSEDGYVDIYKKLSVTTRYGLKVDSITNALAISAMYVAPSIFDGYGTNILYRPVMQITNETPIVLNTNTYPDNTNTPPNP